MVGFPPLWGSGFRVQGSGLRAKCSGFRVRGSGCRVQGAGCRVQGAGFRVQGEGFRVRGSGEGFRVQTLGVEATTGVFAPSAAGCAFVCESVGGRLQGVGFAGEPRS